MNEVLREAVSHVTVIFGRTLKVNLGHFDHPSGQGASPYRQ